MHSSLLLNQSEEQLEHISILNSSLLFSNNNNLLQDNNNDEEYSSLFIRDEKNDENSFLKEKVFPFENINIKYNDNLFSVYDNHISENTQNLDIHGKLNTINNITDNISYLNLNQISMLTTSNSNISNNIGVKNEDIKKKDINQNENINDKIFKCDFLENISLGLDENDDNYYYNNDKKKINLNNPTSLLAAIINLMKEKGPLDIKTIISYLESKKNTFIKANGSKYKQDFKKLIRITLNTPDIFYKMEDGNKFYFIEDKTAYYLKKKRERGM